MIVFDYYLQPVTAFSKGTHAIFMLQRATDSKPIQFIRTFNVFEFESETGRAINLTDVWSWTNYYITDSREAIAMNEEYVFFTENESITYCDYDSIYLTVSHL